VTNCSETALKVSSIFQGKLREEFGPENCNFQMLTKMKILESIGYVISPKNLFRGQYSFSVETEKYY